LKEGGDKEERSGMGWWGIMGDSRFCDCDPREHHPYPSPFTSTPNTHTNLDYPPVTNASPNTLQNLSLWINQSIIKNWPKKLPTS